MKLFELLNVNQPKLHFEYNEDSEGNKNRGWQLDEITAYNDIEEVGYVKIAYIPAKRFKEWNPGILNFISNMEGSYILPYNHKSTPIEKIPFKELKTPGEAAHYLRGYISTEIYKKLDEFKDDEKKVRIFYKELEKEANIKYGKKLKEFKHYFIDNPYISYINVKPEYKKQHIGTALYDAGNSWMKSKGMKLFGSGTQSSEAKAVWDKFEKAGHVDKVTMKYYQKNIVRRYLK